MYKVKFADIGEGLTEGTVTEVMIKPGQTVKMGDALFNVETDKVTSDIPSPINGVIAKILIQKGQEIKVGDVVVEINDGKNENVVATPATPEVEEENASVVGSTPVSNSLLTRGRKTSQPQNNQQDIVSNPEPVISKPQLSGPNHYDVIIVGGGVGGYVSAIKCAQLGLKTMIVEKNKYGGVCLNIGCIPTKTLLKSSYVYEQIINEAAEFGIKIAKTNIKLDWNKIQARKNNVVDKLTSGVKSLLKKNKVTMISGEATALDQYTISVDNKKYTCENMIIATGSIPNGLKLPGAEAAVKDGWLIDSTAALNLKTIPKSLVVIGGGVIGVEFASMFKQLGTKVTILQFMPTILEMLDSDVSNEMTKELLKHGNLEIITNVNTKEFKKNHEVVYEVGGKTHTIKADYVLQSVGRQVVTTGFDNIGINKNEKGHILVDEYCRTNLNNVYAIGDVTGRIMLAHVASHQGIIAANHIASLHNIKDAHDLKMRYDRIPSCIYTHPEVAVIGYTEEQLKHDNIEYQAYKFPFAAIGKALADGNTVGFVKLICEPKYKQILGAHIIANTATDMISEITSVIESEGTITEIARAIHPHPTLSEAIGEAAEALESGKPINW
ncbi:dihydrolipoyl dehydrogenase [Spiroplasma endosymbiont of Crioceris asparagi]|uniref:dihydrolipoyl dehydrogenase n=1 Tax=Spiroplasma endosymbiont of Crioceris asparagi TaxID=3066286 RepID=UPI0030D08DD5